ncbi:MAG: hypothetical protein U0929_03225 [Planctomycetaceae bacterium]
MTHIPGDLISRYLDDGLTSDELREFQNWLRSSPEHIRQFTRSCWLHDRLRGELQAISQVPPTPLSSPLAQPVASSRRPLGARVLVACMAVVVAVLSLVWWEVGTTQVSAASELNRLIVAQESTLDKTYEIDVEEIAASRHRMSKRSDDQRPPKPPLDGAVLHVRHGGQFVLIRDQPDGRPFITGSNGLTSWAIRPDGPVRFSRDLTRFNRDLPGHEQDIPLIQIEDGLKQIREAYDTHLLPIENVEDNSGQLASRLLVAVKKRGYRGPQRIEMTYTVATGQIRQLRFVEMPYGPERLTLRMTLVEERTLPADFFDYQSHCSADRIVEEE